MKKILNYIDKKVMKYLGFMLYPTCKQGKEERNKRIQQMYK